MKLIVTQTGARRGYAVPKILADAGMLERFYTDICGNAGFGKIIARWKNVPLAGDLLTRLANRRVPEEVLPYTYTFESPWIWNAIRTKLTFTKNPETSFRRHLAVHNAWARKMIKSGFGQASHVYSMLSESGIFLREARHSNLKVIAEAYILISTEKILEYERDLFPDWEPEQPGLSGLRQQLDKENHILKDIDHYICPSEAVLDDLVLNWGVKKENCSIVPYGISLQWLNIEPRPIPKRILFVGTADLRKGIHYLAQAAEILARRGKTYEYRIIGHANKRICEQRICQYLNFLGRIPRNRIYQEFEKADVFVLPSLAEGSAEVSYEALGAGVPQVVTRAVGSVARDGIEGLIVPERDPTALADAIERIVEDRQLREKMAAAARVRARDYTWDKYGKRLIAALQRVGK